MSSATKAAVYDPTKPFNQQIRKLIASTHSEDGPIRVRPFGKRFVVEKASRLSMFSELQGTDGIGTKGLLHWKMGTEEHGVQDAFAMVVDDLIESGHIPVMLQDHIQIQEEDQSRIIKIVSRLAELCIENGWESLTDRIVRPIAITGGETAVINTLQGFEVGITGIGYARRGKEIEPRIRAGDRIIGLGSSGIHSNGLSFFREQFFERQQLPLDFMLPWGATIGQELTVPTRVYLGAIKDLLRQGNDAYEQNHGMVHITGGALSKLRELLPKDNSLNIVLNADHALRPQSIFTYSQERFGVPSEDMYMRFNNGIGYVIAVDRDYAETALKTLRKHVEADIIGGVGPGTGTVIIKSAYEPVEIAIGASAKKFIRT